MTGSFLTLHQTPRVLRAVLTNQLALWWPAGYVRMTGQTGRGEADTESDDDIAQYFRRSVDDYFARLGVAPGDVGAYLAGKTLMEYGPGDLPGVAALMVAKGADKVYCVDRFSMVRLSEKNVRVMARLLATSPPAERERLQACLVNPADPAAGFRSERIEYKVRASGLSGLHNCVDLVYSRAVLEHVNDLPASFDDMVRALKPGALAIHQVDLRSHGLHQSNRLDFLAWPDWLWGLMYSAKGVPNRWRVDRYRAIVSALPVDVLALEATERAEPTTVTGVRPVLARPFSTLTDEDLSWLGLWLMFRKR